MPYAVDKTTYRKDTHLPVGVGWSMRPGGIRPTTIVIHTTSAAAKNTTFNAEARYLYNSRAVSAHYLNGKESQIVQFLHPDLEAWHAGAALTAYQNLHSIGIENHVSLGEQWTPAQHDSLTWLVKRLMAQYAIAPSQIETHRRVALPGPNIRKHDPASWNDAAFYAWRDNLITTIPTTWPARTIGLPIYQRSDHSGALAGHLHTGEDVVIDDLSNGHLSDHRGFVDIKGLETL